MPAGMEAGRGEGPLQEGLRVVEPESAVVVLYVVLIQQRVQLRHLQKSREK